MSENRKPGLDWRVAAPAIATLAVVSPPRLLPRRWPWAYIKPTTGGRARMMQRGLIIHRLNRPVETLHTVERCL